MENEFFRSVRTLNWRTLCKQGFFYFFGIAICMPGGVVLTINAHLGAGSFDATNFAVAQWLGVPVSIGIYLTCGLVCLLTAFIRRGWPRISTFVTSFILGFFTNVWVKVFENVQGTVLWQQIALLVIGLLVSALGIASCIASKWPANPPDDMIVALVDSKGWSIRRAKLTFDIISLAFALLLRGEIGVGTVLCTFGLGPIIDFFHKYIARICPQEYALPTFRRKG